jgi:hypothetical protein
MLHGVTSGNRNFSGFLRQFEDDLGRRVSLKNSRTACSTSGI